MTRSALGFSILALFVSACDPATPGSSDADAVARGPLGKADLKGSCEGPGGGYCGGQSDGACWCDEACVEYGDCCGDVADVCGGGPEPEPTVCGGSLGDSCGDDEYCAYEAGQQCGAIDTTSTCQLRPDVCPEIQAPVCGCDGQTYSNSCRAAMAGTGVLSEDECETQDGPMSFTGTCTYVDRPGWLSCPTGMSCTCYYHYNETQYPAIELEASFSEGQLEIFASDVPNNPVLSSLPARIVPLETGLDGSQTGSVAPYQVTVPTSGSATIDVHRSTGYVPRSFVVHTSSDCGNNGKTLDCELVRTGD